ncbi:TonB family protein [Candidatus Omnitrophota bacterium]
MSHKRHLEKIKISYYKIKEEPARKKISKSKIQPIIQKLPKVQKEEILKSRPMATKSKKSQAEKRTVVIKDIKKAKEKKFETVIQEEQDLEKKATYISYYKAVREKIRKHTDRNYPRNRRLGQGEVFLSFRVASSGELIEVKVIDEKSVDYLSLRNIAINSIRDASPFPPFPKGMSHYQISFNVIISFESNK